MVKCVVLVFPSLTEGFGLPALEALSLWLSGDRLQHRKLAGGLRRCCALCRSNLTA
ncbi:MAG: hypothetical protein WBW81_08100 [Methylocella sp.]